MPRHQYVPLQITPKQLSNLLAPKIRLASKSHLTLHAHHTNAHQCNPQHFKACIFKVHEATTKKCFGNKHLNLLHHGCGWRERERSLKA
jgi:hypothetical protein